MSEPNTILLTHAIYTQCNPKIKSWSCIIHVSHSQAVQSSSDPALGMLGNRVSYCTAPTLAPCLFEHAEHYIWTEIQSTYVRLYAFTLLNYFKTKMAFVKGVLGKLVCPTVQKWLTSVWNSRLSIVWHLSIYVWLLQACWQYRQDKFQSDNGRCNYRDQEGEESWRMTTVAIHTWWTIF